MELFTILLILMFQSRMVLLRKNKGTLLKLFILFYCFLIFVLNFKGSSSTTIHLINKISSSDTSILSLFEKLYGYCLGVKHSKLSSHSIIFVFLGYGKSKKMYCCFDPISHKLYVSRHVFFLEHNDRNPRFFHSQALDCINICNLP